MLLTLAAVPPTLSLPPIVILCGLVLSGCLSGLAYIGVHERRRLACDGCRIDAGGGSLYATPHSCSRRKALYVDKNGRLHQFGKPVRTLAEQAFYRGRGTAANKKEEGNVVRLVQRVSQRLGESDRKVTEEGKQTRRATLRGQR